MSYEQQRYYIYVSWKNGREPTQIHDELVNAEGEDALSLRTIQRWIRTFKDGDESVSDKARSGRPREVVTSEKIAKVDELVNDDPHITTTELATQVGISRERITHICAMNWTFTKSVQNGFLISFRRTISGYE